MRHVAAVLYAAEQEKAEEEKKKQGGAGGSGGILPSGWNGDRTGAAPRTKRKQSECSRATDTFMETRSVSP